MEGAAFGFYTGPLNAVVTHLRLTGENEYKGEGFSVISYTSTLGQGEGFAYNQFISSGKTEFRGLFKDPLLGKLSALLDENKSSKTLTGSIEKVDLGTEPKPDLKVKVWSLQNVSPGQRINYIIEYRNDGIISSHEVAVVMNLCPFVQYISSSPGAEYVEGNNEVAWDIGSVSAKTVGYLAIQVEIMWGLPAHIFLNNYAYIESFQWHSQIIGTIRNGVGLPRAEYYDQNNVSVQRAQYKSWRSAASKYNSNWQPILNTENDPLNLADSLHAALASSLFGDGEENPIPTDFNGLNQNSESRDYSIEYSGGNAVGDGALKLGRETIITSEGKDFTRYKVSSVLFDPEKLLPLYKEKGINKVVLYQSKYDDLMAFNGIIYYDPNVGWIIKDQEGGTLSGLPSGFMAKIFGASDVIHLFEAQTGKQVEWLNLILSTQTDGKYGSDLLSIKISDQDKPISLFLQGDPKTGKLFQQSDFANIEGIEIEVRDRSEYRVPHKGWQTWMLNCEDILTGVIDNNAATNFVGVSFNENTTAHDPNELLVSPEGDIRAGDKLNYTINYENEGEGVAFGVYITDALEEDLDDSTLTVNNGGIYNAATRTITWFIGEVASKQQGSISLSVNVNSDAQDNAEVINFATVYFPSVPETTRTNGTVNMVTTFIDNIAPTTTMNLTPSANTAGWNNVDVTITLTTADNNGGSGVAKTEYGFDNIDWTFYNNPFIILNEGLSNVYYRSCDNADNIELSKSVEIKIDKTQPTITSQVSPQPNLSSWNNTDTTVSFAATDNLSGVTSITEPITITTEGANQNIGGEARDAAGNTSTTYVTLNIDKTPPQVSLTSPKEDQEYFHTDTIPLDYSVSDTLSGISSSQLTLDGVDITGQANIQTSVGNHVLTLTAIDQAGNQTTLNRNFTVKLQANVTIMPRVFLEGQGIFIALVKFPQGYNIRSITDAVCDGAPSKKIVFPFNYAIILFKKEDITQLPLDTTFTLRGHFNNGLVFEGTDTIRRVIKKGSLFKLLFEKLKRAEDKELKPYKAMANF
ncbi:MAG: hypothetical protein ABIG31_02930 [Candidatus Omnitrophota bacterium]